MVSGYFNPLHKGHVRMLDQASMLCDDLIVIVNSDDQVKLKGSIPFMEQKERAEIVSHIKGVSQVIISIDTDRTVRKTIRMIKPDVFMNGGDRSKAKDVPETSVCRKLKTKMIFSVGGNKVQSSSGLIENARKNMSC